MLEHLDCVARDEVVVKRRHGQYRMFSLPLRPAVRLPLGRTNGFESPAYARLANKIC